MCVPEHLWRHPTAEAIESLARRFDLPNGPGFQDWEWIFADPKRIDEFVNAYESGELNDDEKFTLMEMIIASFEDLDEQLEENPKWQKVLRLIDGFIGLHIHSVWYWSDLENDNLEDSWRVAPFFRAILTKHKAKFTKLTDTPEPQDR